jgi:hypothetical protein
MNSLNSITKFMYVLFDDSGQVKSLGGRRGMKPRRPLARPRIGGNRGVNEIRTMEAQALESLRRDRITPHEKLRLLSVTGGVPRYLEEMNPALSADVNIQRMCFTPEGLLFKEFDLIFHDLFSRRDKVYREIVAALVNGSLDLAQP